MTNSIVCEKGSGNVYKDLGFHDAEELQAKAVLASRIITIIEHKRWTQAKAAEKLGISQPKVSQLSRGQFTGFSMEKLIGLLNKLNQDVDIVIKNRHSTKKGIGHLNVIYGAI